MKSKNNELNQYWVDRQERELNKISTKTQKDIDRQLNKYYTSAMKKVMSDFEAVYDKLLSTIEDGRAVTVADLYKLDKYWQSQAQLRALCEELGNKEIALLSKQFEKQWEDVYKASALPSDIAFSTVSTANAHTAIQTIWAADGKTWSSRVWKHTEQLAATLNEQLIHVVATGRSSKDLKNLLQERFNVSYGQANTLVRTEVSRIQTESAAKRYKDAGLEEYMILGREHDSCKKYKNSKGVDCHKLNGKKFRYDEAKIGINMPPFHPNCKCRIAPVVKSTILQRRLEEVRKEEALKREEKRKEKETRELTKGMKG